MNLMFSIVYASTTYNVVNGAKFPIVLFLGENIPIILVGGDFIFISYIPRSLSNLQTGELEEIPNSQGNKLR